MEKLLLNLNKATYVIYKNWYDGDVKKTTLIRGPYTIKKNAVKEFKELFKTMKDIHLIEYTVVADELIELTKYLEVKNGPFGLEDGIKDELEKLGFKDLYKLVDEYSSAATGAEMKRIRDEAWDIIMMSSIYFLEGEHCGLYPMLIDYFNINLDDDDEEEAEEDE